jgi:enoyl-CoA hydratase
MRSLEVSASDGIVVLTFARPELLNRVDDDLREDLIEALSKASMDNSTRAIVLAAEGGVFSAGGDFAMIRARNGDSAAVEYGGVMSRRLIDTLLDVPVPLIAAVHGDAVGVGATIVLACDIVVSTPGVRIMDSHVKVGLVAGDGGTLLWPASVGMIRAKRFLLTGDPLLAEDAYAIGIVTDLVQQRDEVLPTATEIADRIAALPPLGVRGTKKSLSQGLRLRAAETLELSLALEGTSIQSADVLEALDAFQEKRPGRYEGR